MKIAIYGQNYKSEASKYIDILLATLRENKVEVVIEFNFHKLLKERKNVRKSYQTFSSYKDLDATFDMLFTVGGDGTFLRSITYVRDHNIPILGINIGRLGFLANVQKGKIKEAIKSVLKKNYSVKERTLLKVTTDDLDGFNIALNEVTVVRKDSTAMITIETYLDNEFLTSYWADGLIVSTPTGSTGYSLSCGGPVITPSARNLVLTPIAPHNLNARPLVIPDNTKIELKVIGREKNALLSLDSRIITIQNNTTVVINKASYSIKTVLLNNQSFLKTLRKKLLWGEDVRND